MSKNKSNARNVSNKAAPKPPAKAAQVMGAKGATAKVNKSDEVDVEDEDDDEEEDEEIEVISVDPATGKKVRKSQKMRVIGTLLRGEKQLSRLIEKVNNTPELQDLAKLCVRSVRDCLERAEKLPDDWKRAAVARVSKQFSPGDIVAISEAHRSKYEGLLDEDEFDDLTVVKQIDNKVALRTRKGSKTFFPAHHVQK